MRKLYRIGRLAKTVKVRVGISNAINCMSMIKQGDVAVMPHKQE